MVGRYLRILALVGVAGGCGGGEGVYDALPQAESVPVLAADYGLCTPVARRANASLVWCGALGGTCATASACDFIDGGSAEPAVPPVISRSRETRLTVFLRKNCRGHVSGAELLVDGAVVDTLGVGPPGLSIPIETGAHTVAAESPEGFGWASFTVSVPAWGLIQPLTCR